MLVDIRFERQVDESLDTGDGQESGRPSALEERELASASAASSTSCFRLLVQARVLGVGGLSIGCLCERCLGIGLAVFRAVVAALADGAVVVLCAILGECRVASKHGVLRVDCGRHDGQLVDSYRESSGSDGTDGRSGAGCSKDRSRLIHSQLRVRFARAASVVDGRAMKGDGATTVGGRRRRKRRQETERESRRG